MSDKAHTKTEAELHAILAEAHVKRKANESPALHFPSRRVWNHRFSQLYSVGIRSFSGRRRIAC